MADDSLKVKFEVDASSALGRVRAFKADLETLKGALGAASNKSLDTETRLRGINAAAGLAGSAVTAFASHVIGLARSADEANVRLEVMRGQASTLGRAVGEVQRATGGAAGQTEAWAARNALLGAGLRANAEQIGTLVEAARRHREAGESTSEAMGRLTSAIGGSREEQERFGISLSEGASNADRMAQATRLLADEQRRRGVIVQTEAERQAQLNENVSRGRDAIVSFLADSTPYVAYYRAARDAVGALGERLSRTQQATERATSATRENVTAVQDARTKKDEYRAIVEDTARTIENLKTKTEQAAAAAREQAAAVDAATAALKRSQEAANQINFTNTTGLTQAEVIERNRAAGVDQIARARREQFNRRQAATLAEGTMIPDPRTGRMRRITRAEARGAFSVATGGGTGPDFGFLENVEQTFRNARAADIGLFMSDPGITARSRPQDAAAAVRAMAGQLGATNVAGITRRPGETEVQFAQRLLPALQADATARREQEIQRATGRKQGESATLERENAREAELREQRRVKAQSQYEVGVTAANLEKAAFERGDMATQFRDQFLPAAEQTRTAAEKMAEGVKGAFDTMSGAIASHVQALIEGRESFGEAMRGIVHDTLLGLAQQAVPRALMETAQGIAALTNPVTAPTAPMHFAAAGVYAGVAALAGLGAAATAPSAGAAQAQAGAGARIAPAASAGQLGAGSSSGPAVITINVNGAVVDREGFEQAIAQGVRGAQSRGLLAA